MRRFRKRMAIGISSGMSLPLRRGVYNSSSGQGFGYDKAFWKHGLRSVAAVRFVMNGPGSWQGSDWTTQAYANKIRCARTCYVEASQPVRSVASRDYQNYYYGRWVGGTLGLKTAYCLGSTVCTSWVTGALDGTSRSASPSGSDSQNNYPNPTTSDQLYLTYEELPAGSTVAKENFDAQLKDFTAQDNSVRFGPS